MGGTAPGAGATHPRVRARWLPPPPTPGHRPHRARRAHRARGLSLRPSASGRRRTRTHCAARRPFSPACRPPPPRPCRASRPPTTPYGVAGRCLLRGRRSPAPALPGHRRHPGRPVRRRSKRRGRLRCGRGGCVRADRASPSGALRGVCAGAGALGGAHAGRCRRLPVHPVTRRCRTGRGRGRRGPPRLGSHDLRTRCDADGRGGDRSRDLRRDGRSEDAHGAGSGTAGDGPGDAQPRRRGSGTRDAGRCRPGLEARGEAYQVVAQGSGEHEQHLRGGDLGSRRCREATTPPEDQGLGARHRGAERLCNLAVREAVDAPQNHGLALARS